MIFNPRNSATRRARPRSAQDLGRSLRIEPLESRILLDGEGFLNGTDVHLSLSFAPDGTQIAGQSSALAATFDAIAPTADWQEAILKAFQTWAVETNADIGVVTDSGDPLGTPGRSQRDERFGDIRIGAIDMSPTVGAVSVPVTGVVTGTWFGDVVFNTAFAYQSLDDIFAVALHEAGNVFGLADSSDVNSPLFTGGTPTVLPPTATDIANLQQLHGVRMSDLNELPGSGGGTNSTNNDSFANATRLQLVEAGVQAEGTAPSIVYGDISSQTDRDFFELKTPGDYVGSVTLQVRSAGISLLAPRVTVYDSAQQIVSQTVSTSITGDLIISQIPAAGPDETYFLEVAGAAPNLFGRGSYSVVATLDAINQIDQATIDSLAAGQFRFLEQDDFKDFFDTNEDDFFAVDLNSNDTLGAATGLQTAPGFVSATRYEITASIDNNIDVDFYQAKAPPPSTVPLDVMTVYVRSLDVGGLIPQVSVFDKNDQPVAVTILANGGGDYILQAQGITAGDNYKIQVGAEDANGPFNTGNYNLVVSFGSNVTQLTPLSSGVVGNGTTQNIHTLYIGQPQLFHLALEVDPATVTAPTVIVATIFNDAHQPVYQIAVKPGETRSREAVFLQSGTYTVEIVPLTLNGSVPPALSYALLGTSISDPFVGDPNDPTTNPFACTEPGMAGLFCYPGGFVSPDPFLWDTFINSLSTPPDSPDLATLITNLLGDWWSWVWNTTGVNGPPLALSDTAHVPDVGALTGPAQVAAVTFVGPTGTVLGNDIDPEGDAVVAIKKSDPLHGSLTLDPDGTFVYTPQVGFVGRDEFTYAAFDFVQESAVATVSIVVGISGDFNADGNVDGVDFLIWQRGAGQLGGAVLTDGDSNFDGNVDALDLSVWEQQFAASQAPVPSNGDANGDGQVDGLDFLAWQRGFGTTSGATASDGDADADGDVDAADLAIWQQNFGTGATTSASTQSASPQVAALTVSYNTSPPSNSPPPSVPQTATIVAQAATAAPTTPVVSSNASSSSKQLQSGFFIASLTLDQSNFSPTTHSGFSGLNQVDLLAFAATKHEVPFFFKPLTAERFFDIEVQQRRADIQARDDLFASYHGERFSVSLTDLADDWTMSVDPFDDL